MLSDIEIAQRAELKPIREIAEKIGIPSEDVENYGPVSYTHLTLPTIA